LVLQFFPLFFVSRRRGKGGEKAREREREQRTKEKRKKLTAEPRDVLLHHDQQQRRDAQEHDFIGHRVQSGEEPELVPRQEILPEPVSHLIFIFIFIFGAEGG
jgi:hypothetical protein